MTDQALTPDAAREEYKQLDQWWTNYQRMVNQAPQVQQRLSFLNGYLERDAQNSPGAVGIVPADQLPPAELASANHEGVAPTP